MQDTENLRLENDSVGLDSRSENTNDGLFITFCVLAVCITGAILAWRYYRKRTRAEHTGVNVANDIRENDIPVTVRTHYEDVLQQFKQQAAAYHVYIAMERKKLSWAERDKLFDLVGKVNALPVLEFSEKMQSNLELVPQLAVRTLADRGIEADSGDALWELERVLLNDAEVEVQTILADVYRQEDVD